MRAVHAATGHGVKYPECHYNMSVHPSVFMIVRLSGCLSIFLVVWLSSYPVVRLSGYPVFRPSVCPFVRPSVCLYVRPSICSSVCPSIHLLVHMSIHLYVHPSVRLSVCSSVGLSVCRSVVLSTRPPFHPSIHSVVCGPFSFLYFYSVFLILEMITINISSWLSTSLFGKRSRDRNCLQCMRTHATGSNPLSGSIICPSVRPVVHGPFEIFVFVFNSFNTRYY